MNTDETGQSTVEGRNNKSGMAGVEMEVDSTSGRTEKANLDFQGL